MFTSQGRFITALEHGRWTKLFEDDDKRKDFYRFVNRAALTPSVKQFAIRFNMIDPGEKKENFYLWAIYDVWEEGLKLSGFIVPKKKGLLELPEELENVPVFKEDDDF